MTCGPVAISRSFCLYRAGCRDLLSLASAIRAERASHSERAARIWSMRTRGTNVRWRNDTTGVEARRGLLLRSKREHAAGLVVGTLRIT
jgi:hypothetical protein